MSAPNAGRQSPEPDKQSGAQGKDAPGVGSVGEPSSDQAESSLESTLESNPQGPLEDAAKEKVSKEGRGNF